MPIIAQNSSTEFVNAPQGTHQGVCCDVVDLGLVDVKQPDGSAKKVHKIEVYWQIPAINPETLKRFEVRKRYTLSFHEKSTLRKDVEAWRGKPFPKDQKEFDVEALLGINAMLNVQHQAATNGKVYANVMAVMALPEGMPPIMAVDYVRRAERKAA